MAVKYPYIPKGRTILYVSENNTFIKAARVSAYKLSKDKLQSTGAVVVRDGRIIGSGANQVILKNSKLQELHRKGFCLRKLLKVKSGTKYWLCPACSGSRTHAESQAVLDTRKNGEDIVGADLYLWGHWWCCKPCWDNIIKAGIRNVYLLEGSEKLFNTKSSNHILGRQFNQK
jgi:deoxycytidylate deaminase